MLINFNYGVEEFSGEFTRVDQKKVMGFAEDIIREMVKGFFDHSSLIRRDQNGFVLVLSVAETPDYETQLRLMGEKLQRVLKDYFEVSVSISASRPGKSIEEFQMLYYQATGAMNYTYYDWADSIVFYSEACESGSRHSNDFNISFLKKDLSRCLRQNDSEGFGRIMDQVISLLEAGRPARHQAINACSSLYYFITAFFEDREDICFPYVVDIIGQLNRMKHSSSMIQWIGWFRDEVKKLLSQASEVKLDKHVELAKRYVQEHCREKISLSQTAEALNISPGYLSSSFKKQTGKNFSDYVNEVKVEEARKLIATHQYMMYEISDLLGFDTQYYFSTVFKKMTGQSPREYEMQIL